MHTKPNNLPWTNPKPRKGFIENDIEWIEEEYSKSGILRMFKNKRLRKFSYKGGKKGIVPLYPRNYANEKRSHKNRKVGRELRLACVKETMHDMLNMPMNESHLVWPLKQLLYLQELAKLKAINHRYHMWKDYLERDNEQIVEWNATTREVCGRKICNIMIVVKQGMPKDFWFKPYIGKFSGEKFA